MARYKVEKNRSIFSDLHNIEIKDRKTGRIGKGFSSRTWKEAEDNAWKDLKFGKPKYYGEPSGDYNVSSGGGGGGGGDSLDWLGCLFVVFFLVCNVLVGGVLVGLDYLIGLDNISRKTEDLIKRVYPVYETRFESYKQRTTFLVTYLSADEMPITTEFIRIDLAGHFTLIDTNSNKTLFEEPLEKIEKVEFETLSNKVVKSWPSQFESMERVPKILIVVTYPGSFRVPDSTTYSDYATRWAYIYPKEGNRIELYLCRIKEIRMQKRP